MHAHQKLMDEWLCKKHIYFPVKRYKYSIYSMVSSILTSLNEISGNISYSLRMRNYGNYLKIYVFMCFRTSRDKVGRFLPCLTQILVCVVKWDQIVCNGSEFCLAHAQRKFVEVVLYLKIINSPTLTSVESFMLVSGIAQSWLLAA